MIDGVSSRTRSEIAHLERTRNYLQPGEVTAAVRLWKDHVHQTERQLWRDYDRGGVHWYCCGSPLEARALIATVMHAMSPRAARELRKIIHKFDAAYSPPLPSREGGGR
ncbi:hypothetical protein GCM10009664_37180 [Kitasatospora gansuensis]